MKPSLFFSSLALCFLFSGTMAAMSHPPDHDASISLQGRLNTTCIPHRGGTVYLTIDVITEGMDRPDEMRRPMNIAVVLDRSGSMADERKMEYAKKAVLSLIERLSSNDYLSIVIYDDRVETIWPMQRVADRSRIKRLIQEISPRGSTNLGGGMMEGFRQIEQCFKREYVNRVVLVSDGLANQGITDPQELGRIAGGYRSRSISLSAIGVGLEYNENLMLGLAESGGGNYYFVESPSQLASIFERELSGMSNIVAQNARIELMLGRGVSVGDIIECEWTRGEGQVIIPVGDLYAKSRRPFTVELHIPEGSGTREIANGVLRWDGESGRSPRFSVDIRYTDDIAEIEKGRDWDTQAKVDVALTTRKVERAMTELDAGNRLEAVRAIGEAQSMLQSSQAMTNSAAGAPMMQEQLLHLREYAKDIQDESKDARKVKKTVQYRNYRTQKKEE